MLADVSARLSRLDWQAVETGLWRDGYAKTEPLLSPDECKELAALYDDDRCFRSHVDMGRLGFGQGAYKYFQYPLPALIQEVRTHAYPPLSRLANDWAAALKQTHRYPSDLRAFLEHCRREGQSRATPLLLRYSPGGYNCLHQDLYGSVVFPFQLAIFLSRREQDYQGGEFLLVEQRPRAQSRGTAIATNQGEGIIFTTRYRPVAGRRGYYRANIRHGVSKVHSGSRYTLGVIFHDAR